MAAAAVALPLVTGLRAALGFLLEPGTRDEVRFTGDPLAVVLSGVPVALALWIAVALQNRGRAAPPLWVSAALGAVSAFAGTLVVVPDVLQRWRDPCCDPGRGPTPGTDVWVPQLVAPTLIAMVVVGLVVLLAKRRPPA
jgi:FtsH-binding integral membrane protein